MRLLIYAALLFSWSVSLAEDALSPADHYNLGLVAETSGDFELAREHYLAAANQDEDLDTQAMADDALILLPFSTELTEEGPSLLQKNFAYVSGTAKSVNGLVDPNDSFALDESDSAFELLLAGSLSVWSPSPVTDFRIGANLFREEYSDFSDYDISLLGGWAEINRIIGNTTYRLQIAASDVDLGGDDYLSYADIGLSAEFPISAGWDLRLSGLFRDVSSDDVEYDHYAGDVWQAAATLDGEAGNPWRIQYAFRNEDRGVESVQYENLLSQIFEGSLAYSRRYHRLQLNYDFDWANGMSQSLTGSLRSTRYDDDSLFLNASTDRALTTRTRDAFRYAFSTEISWPLTDRMRLVGTIEYFNEDSNIDQYDSDSTQFGLGMDYLF